MYIKAFLISCLFLVSSFAENAHGVKETEYKIQINLWTNELQLVENGQMIKSFPIASGKLYSPTPIGKYMVVEKSKDWGGGFGTRWLGLNVPWGIYGIHGTNKPFLIGKNVSSGCIRMRNQDVEELYQLVSEGTVVEIKGTITGQDGQEIPPLSLGSKGNLVFLVQQRLKLAGFFPGKENGIYGLRTQMAVKEFQKAVHLPITGSVSRWEYFELGLWE